MNLVFAHGVLFPQHVGPVNYFRGLQDEYPDALFPTVPIVADVAVRADELGKQIKDRDFPPGPIHIVAHSMGGLDARRFLATGPKDITTRVATLSTIATPHHGSLAADLVAGKLGLLSRIINFLLIRTLVKAFPALRQNALDNLTTEFAAQFNAQFGDLPNVTYYSYAGNNHTSLALTPTHEFIARQGGTSEETNNDGLVTIASAKWTNGLTEEPWPADHFGLVGHDLDTLDLITSFDHKAAFRRVVDRALSTPPRVK